MRGSFLRGLAISSVIAVAFAPVAFAQPGTTEPYPSCVGKTPSPDDVAAAKKTYELGNRYMAEADYDRAISYFRDAYRSDCSAHKLLGFIARAYELRGDRAEAVRALETYLERAAPDADDRGTVQKRVANLKAQIAAQPVTSGSASASPAPSAAPAVAPEASAKAQPASPPAPSTAPREHTVAPWIVVGMGGAAAIAGAIMTPVGGAQVSEAEKECPTRALCRPEVRSKGNNGRTIGNVGVGLLAGGLAVAAGGLLWHFLEPSDRRVEGAARVRPLVLPDFAGASVEGRF